MQEISKNICSNQEIRRYYVFDCKRAENIHCDGILFYNKAEALETCKNMNDIFEGAVDEKIKEMFKNGKMICPFDFLEAWENKNTDLIKSKFPEPALIINCDFANDLLIIYDSNSGYFTNESLAKRLCVEAIWRFSTLTMHYRVTIINVAKIKEHYNER